MGARKVIIRNLNEINTVSTSHDTGLKQVALASDETISMVTQIARTTLCSGNIVPDHVHPTMDEHFVFLSGNIHIATDGDEWICGPGDFVLIPAGVHHSLCAVSDVVMLTIGVAI